ncbi:MAG: universal stress protein [Planctomycetes bacterium]|nr:universal stress protein [Planctomycetota bacterium]
MRIAVCTDFSERSKEAFAFATALADKFSAEIFLVHHAARSLFMAPGQLELLHASLEKKLAALPGEEPAFQKVKPTPLLVRGGNARSFGESLAAKGIDLLVLSTHGRTGVARFLMGSFVERAIQFAPCSVLVCRKPASEGDSGEEKAFGRILIAHDFSLEGALAAETARQWTQAFQARARMLHVVDSECGVTGFEIELFSDWREYHEKMKERALEQLRSIAEKDWAETNVEVDVAIGHPVLEILAQAEEFEANLIVMGTHGGACQDRFLLGTVAEKIVRKAPCTVLLVRGAET